MTQQIFRLPTADTLEQSLEKADIVVVEETDEYENPKNYGIPNVYSICECVIKPRGGDEENWFLVAIQEHYPYPFMEGSFYREITYYLYNHL